MESGLLSRILPTSIGGLILLVVFLLGSYQLAHYIYNILFHPLRRFPGPFSAKFSNLPAIYQSLKGASPYWIVSLHLKYGQIVRVSPNELSFSDADAWKDIYGHKRAGLSTLEKDPKFYTPPVGDPHTIIDADFDAHARMRRIFSHAFSDRALKLQEPLFLTYVDRLVQKIRDGVATDPNAKHNMVNMYNFTTFDIMGDLTFGEPLNMLSNSSYHPWVAAMFAGFKFGSYLHAIRYFTTKLELILIKYFAPKSILDQHKLHKEFSVARVDRRLEKQGARPDIWGLVLEKEGTKGLTQQEMYSNANLFMLAGTETTATLLSGLTFHLLTNPEKLQRLANEVRTSFKNETDISIERLQSLKYLNATIEEGLRMYPPVSPGLPRLTPPGQMTNIAGTEVPPGASIFVTHLAAYRNPNNFKHPNAFVPERWLPESIEYQSDKKHGLQPFSIGPRACLGKNMAYHEMRLILTKVVYNFDMTICEESRNWIDQKIFIMWEKGPLYCKLSPVR